MKNNGILRQSYLGRAKRTILYPTLLAKTSNTFEFVMFKRYTNIYYTILLSTVGYMDVIFSFKDV